MIRININGYEVLANEGSTILEAALSIGIDIPTLCHDKSLETYGACGICAVEAYGSSKLIRACSTVVSPGMVIYTDTPRVLVARKAVLDLLLSDHIGDCRPPCMRACPAETDCQGYVGLIANSDNQASYELLMEKLPLPASIGRVCPHPCEGECRRALVGEPSDKPVAIADLKRFAADSVLKSNREIKHKIGSSLSGKRISVIGGGPGGLSAAYFLALKGADVTIFDAQPRMGGMLRYGIPEYRLPKSVLDAEISVIESLGVKMVNNVRIGKEVSFGHIRAESDAVIIAIGAWVSSRLGCPGEDLPGVVGGIDFLYDIASGKPLGAFNKVAVVGGGNTAMDACRTAIRLGAETVYNIYRRTRAEMPAEDIEIEEAGEEGVEFKFLCNPLEIIDKDGRVAAIKLQKMELGEPDASGRRRPVPIPGAEEIIEVDLVIAAIGQGVDPSGFSKTDKMDDSDDKVLELSRWKTIVADESTFATNLDGVFAIGDAINDGAGIAIEAIGDARHAAESVSDYLRGIKGGLKQQKPQVMVTSEPSAEEYKSKPTVPREQMPHLSPEQRRTNFSEINHGFTREQAIAEAERCLECGCMDYFECKLLKYSREIGADPNKFNGLKLSRGGDDSNPFLMLNRDKCILCGQCVRVCDEVMGRSALGLTERGFETGVSPELKRPLNETSCISCGQCASVCPTGAFSERLAIHKSVPLDERRVNTVCSQCSIGCEAIITAHSHMLLRVLPEGAALCVRGRFAPVMNSSEKNLEAGKSVSEERPDSCSSCIDILSPRGRISAASIRKGTDNVNVSLGEAATALTKDIQRIAGMHGKDAIAVTVSDKLTNEDIYLITQYATKALGLEKKNIFSANLRKNGLKPVLGFNSSTNSMDELRSTDVIMLIAPDIINSHTIAGLKIKNACANGAKLILVAGKETQADEWANIKLDSYSYEKDGSDSDTIAVLKQILAELNPPELEEYLKNTVGTVAEPEVKEAANLLRTAKNAMIVYDAASLGAQAETLIADCAIASGHIGRPRNGIIVLRRNCNSQGLIDIGVNPGAGVLDALIADGRVKALLSFGEDVSGMELAKLDLLAVFDNIETASVRAAHYVIPLTAAYETNGTYTSTDRVIRQVRAALDPVWAVNGADASAIPECRADKCAYSAHKDKSMPLSNAEIITELANNAREVRDCRASSITFGINNNIPGYSDTRDGGFTHGSPYLSFNKNLVSLVPEDNSGFTAYPNTNAAAVEFERYLRENGLLK